MTIKEQIYDVVTVLSIMYDGVASNKPVEKTQIKELERKVNKLLKNMKADFF